MKTNTRTYVRKFAVLEKDINIRSYHSGVLSELNLTGGDRVSIDGKTNYYTEDGDLMLGLNGRHHRISRSGFRPEVETDTVDV